MATADPKHPNMHLPPCTVAIPSAQRHTSQQCMHNDLCMSMENTQKRPVTPNVAHDKSAKKTKCNCLSTCVFLHYTYWNWILCSADKSLKKERKNIYIYLFAKAKIMNCSRTLCQDKKVIRKWMHILPALTADAWAFHKIWRIEPSHTDRGIQKMDSVGSSVGYDDCRKTFCMAHGKDNQERKQKDFPSR